MSRGWCFGFAVWSFLLYVMPFEHKSSIIRLGVAVWRFIILNIYTDSGDVFFSLEFYGTCTCCRKVAILISKPGRFKVATLKQTPTDWFLQTVISLGSASDPARGTMWSFMEVSRSHGWRSWFDEKWKHSVFSHLLETKMFTHKCFYRHPETPMPIGGWFLRNPYRIQDDEGIAYPWTQALFFCARWDFLLVLSKWIFSPPI